MDESLKSKEQQQLKLKLQQRCEYFPLNSKIPENISYRNKDFGVTVDRIFLKDIIENQFLNTNHFVFLMNAFSHFYQNSRVMAADCYFMADCIPSLTIQFEFDEVKQKIINITNQEVESKIDQTKQQELSEFKYDEQESQKMQCEQESEHIKQEKEAQKQLLAEQFKIQFGKVTIIRKDIIGKINWNAMTDKLNQLVLKNNLKNISELKNIYDYFYFPINYDNYHWVSAIISIKEKIIYYQDSVPNSEMNEDVIEFLQSIVYKDFRIDVRFEVLNTSPKQDNLYDCGLFTILSLLSIYNPSFKYCQQVVNEFRQYRIYDLALIGSQIDLTKEEFELLLYQ